MRREGREQVRERGTDLFVQMSSIWRAGLPNTIVKEDPTTLIRILRLGMAEGGMSQSDLKRELGINQPRLSKLTSKLVDAGWAAVERPKADGRVRLVTTTKAAQDRLASLEKSLAALLPDRPSRHARKKGITTQIGQQFFDLVE